MKVLANGIQIEVEDSGADGSQSGRPVVLLVMGLGMQLIAWPVAMLNRLIEAGYRVIRHDNRDIGLSQNFDHLGRPNLVLQGLRFNFGLTVQAPYSLQAMADDALGVLDALGVERAHVLGISMGGMIAQRMAISAPQRLRSLISVMSSSGAANLPRPSPRVQLALLGRPDPTDEEAVVRHYVRLFQIIGSSGFPYPPGAVRALAYESVRRCYRPDGVMRQTLASIADGDRAQALAGVRVPTLVLHGRDDPLVPFACGVDTAERIAGARLQGLAGMGHDLAPGVVDWLLDQVLDHIAST